jgi:hypothetical protein
MYREDRIANENKRSRQGVYDVIYRCPHLHARQIDQERKVGYQQQCGKPSPAVVRFLITQKDGYKNEAAFNTKK